MREETVAQQNTERISPARVRGRLRPTPYGFIHHVIVHERCDVNEFHDHSKIDVVGINSAAGAGSQKSQKRPKAFAATADSIDNVTFDCRIKRCDLLCNARIHLFKMLLNLQRELGERTRMRSYRCINRLLRLLGHGYFYAVRMD